MNDKQALELYRMLYTYLTLFGLDRKTTTASEIMEDLRNSCDDKYSREFDAIEKGFRPS